MTFSQLLLTLRTTVPASLHYSWSSYGIACDFTVADVAKAIAKLKGHKAPGLDNVLPEMLKYGGTAVAEALHVIILEAWESEHTPLDFKRDVVIPILKKAGADAKMTGRWHFNLLQLKCMPWCCSNAYQCGLNSNF